jgi:hypothetical protein
MICFSSLESSIKADFSSISRLCRPIPAIAMHVQQEERERNLLGRKAYSNPGSLNLFASDNHSRDRMKMLIHSYH